MHTQLKSLGVTLVVVGCLMPLSACGESTADRAAAGARQAAEAAAAQAKRDAAAAIRESERLAALWTYSNVEAGKGRQISAAITSTNDVDTNGDGGRSVLLVFRDHPAWGRSSYLVLKAGDFKCSPGCMVKVIVDESAAKSMAARRPPTDEAIAMFINDARALWRAIEGAKRVSIEFPVKAGGTRTASFDIAGLDRSKMPGWDLPQ